MFGLILVEVRTCCQFKGFLGKGKVDKMHSRRMP